VLAATAISKHFGRTLALDRVDFDALPGEIVALLGENGAGKTTLMNVLAGRIRPDSGAATLFGEPLRAGSARAALAVGIAAVNQSPMLFERLSWEENLALGGFAPSGYDLAQVAARARALAAPLGFRLPPPATTVESRSIGERVRLEVLRALSFDPRVLILDEPTGALAPTELAPFLDLLRRLRGEGRIIVLITHKLGEALAVADRITVLRRGRVVARTTPSETSESQLARLMIGELPAAPPPPARSETAGDTLAIDSLSLEQAGRRVLDSLTLTVGAGEIVGIAGVDGNGQGELVEILAGARRATSGTIGGAGAAAMAVIPENRDLDGLVLEMALWENLLLARSIRRRMAPSGFLSRTRALELCREILRRFAISAPGPDALAAALSGGNRQRLAVARALAGNPRVIVAHNICRGLDLAATAAVHRTLLDFAADDGAVLLISSDLDELLSMCGRLFVMNRGRLRETAARERDPERIGLLMAGRWE
jgi:general nucleoside transport system ATP-binding protein